ncbi:MAG: hypothetical protein WCT10_02650 [Patescibacteria group bacterium]|jgi:UDP-2,3-diacylglucosamine pyrophosphatase LpxH
METSEVVVANNQPSGDTGKAAVDEVIYVVSDLHMSEGLAARVRSRPSLLRRVWRWCASLFEYDVPTKISPLNPLEDFPDDRVFVRFLDKAVSLHGSAPLLRLRLLGDMFDPLAVSINGHFSVPPYEETGVLQMSKIIDGHADFFDALFRFVRRPNCRLDIFAGNHDLILVWKKVQELVRARIAGTDAEAASRIRFIDHSSEFMDLHRGVLYYHGMNAEAQNRVDPEAVILTKRFGVPIERPILNQPYGSYLACGPMISLKQKNPLIGRLLNYRGLWKNAALHRWGWTFYAGAVLMWSFVFNALFAFWDIRRKSSIRNTLRIVLETFTACRIDEYAKRLRQERGAKAIIMGHTHEWRRTSDPDGTYVNTGSWTLMYRLVEPLIELKWRRLRCFELPVRVLLHFVQTGELRLARQITKMSGWAALVGAMTVFLFTSFPKEGWRIWEYGLADLKTPIAIMLVFALISGFIRIFAVRLSVESIQRLTYGLVKHRGEEFSIDLMEYLPEEDAFRECV